MAAEREPRRSWRLDIYDRTKCFEQPWQAVQYTEDFAARMEHDMVVELFHREKRVFCSNFYMLADWLVEHFPTQRALVKTSQDRAQERTERFTVMLREGRAPVMFSTPVANNLDKLQEKLPNMNKKVFKQVQGQVETWPEANLVMFFLLDRPFLVLSQHPAQYVDPNWVNENLEVTILHFCIAFCELELKADGTIDVWYRD